MKIKKLWIAVVLLSIALTACGDTVPDMTQDQVVTTSQYAAAMLLKYSDDYEDGILSLSEMEKLMKRTIVPTIEPTPEPEKKDDTDTPNDYIGDGGASGVVVDNRTLADFVGYPGINFNYTGYSIVDSYPETEDEFSFAMDATPGNHLLIIRYDLVNNQGQDEYVDLLSLKLKFRISINDGSSIPALTTLLSDDLKTYQDTIPSMSTVSEVIIVELTPEQVDQLESGSLSLTVKTSDDSLKMALK